METQHFHCVEHLLVTEMVLYSFFYFFLFDSFTEQDYVESLRFPVYPKISFTI